MNSPYHLKTHIMHISLVASRIAVLVTTLTIISACSTAQHVETPKRVGKGTKTETTTMPTVDTGALPAFPASTSAVTAKTDESANERLVRERAQARWDQLLAGNIENAYSYHSPASKQAMPFDLYKSKIRLGSWKSARARRSDCVDSNRCTVYVGVTMKVAGGRVGVLDHESSVTEDWVLVDGQWWFVGR